MGEILDYIITYEKMEEILANYYAEQGKDVKVEIKNIIDEDATPRAVYTTIEIKGTALVDGVPTETVKRLSSYEFKKIIKEILEKEGKKLQKIHNDVVSVINPFSFNHGGEPEYYATNQQFTIKVKEKGKTYAKRLNKKSNY